MACRTWSVLGACEHCNADTKRASAPEAVMSWWCCPGRIVGLLAPGFSLTRACRNPGGDPMGPASMSERGLPPQSAGPLIHAQLTVGVVDGMRVAGGVQRGGLRCGQVQTGRVQDGPALTGAGVILAG